MNRRRPIATAHRGPLAALPWLTPFDLPISSALRRRLKLLAAQVRFHSRPNFDRYLGVAEAEWALEMPMLIGRAISGEDDAIVDLVRRDKRYIGAPLVVAKVVEWYLLKLVAQHNEPDSARRQRRRSEGARAEVLLKKIGQAIGAAAQKAPAPNLAMVKREYREVLDRLEAVIEIVRRATLRGQRIPDAARIARRFGIPNADTAELIRRPRRKIGIAQRITAARFGFDQPKQSIEHFRKILREANTIDEEP